VEGARVYRVPHPPNLRVGALGGSGAKYLEAGRLNFQMKTGRRDKCRFVVAYPGKRRRRA
jgi:hypothetical protein